jgi:hypothetical protein
MWHTRKKSVRKISVSAKDFYWHRPLYVHTRGGALIKLLGFQTGPAFSRQEDSIMRLANLKRAIAIVTLVASILVVGAWMAQDSKGSAGQSQPATPADGHTIHVTAPHVVAGKVMGPYHHYCKVLSPEPVIECLCYRSSDSGARLEQVEYIIAKSITRTGAVSLADWNKNWHDHKQEIATGRVQVHDLPPDKAKEVADLVSTTDGIIFHVWSHDDKVPSANVVIAQSVGHVNLTQAEFRQSAQGSSAAKATGRQ